MPMNFFKLPAEIRLQIYEKLLVSPDPIQFYHPSFPPDLSGYQGCPALLRASKRVHREASPVLYSYNRFEFNCIHPSELCIRTIPTKSAALASFFGQIGHQNASFLRRIWINSDCPSVDNVQLQEENLKMLELIRENCTTVAILEISLHDFWSYDANGSRTIKQAVLESLDARFKAISSLKEVIVRDRDFDGLSMI